MAARTSSAWAWSSTSCSTGRRPFRGESHQEVMDQIANTEPRPPRQIDDTIPRELERICQKMLAKRASDRYSTARDLAEDLRHFLQKDEVSGTPITAPGTVSPPPGSTQEATATPQRPDSDGPTVKVVPKGLRSFDQHDADFFLELLPGPRDRDGLPESLRFWKTRIESTDPGATFRVGLIYGPSGCGKSSLVKAGLLPRLGKTVLPVYVEATPEETEARLLKGLRKVCPELHRGLGLVDSLANLRKGRVLPPEHKVLLVLDQFEQWLFAKRGEENTELVAALRQCDGEHLQAVVMVRDDFWLAASRFMRDLEIRPGRGREHRPRGSLRSSPCPESADGIRAGVREFAREHRMISAATKSLLGSSRFPGWPRTARSSPFGWRSLPRWSKENPGPRPRSKRSAAQRESVSRSSRRPSAPQPPLPSIGSTRKPPRRC